MLWVVEYRWLDGLYNSSKFAGSKPVGQPSRIRNDFTSRLLIQQTSRQGHISRMVPYSFILLRLWLRSFLVLRMHPQQGLWSVFPLEYT